MAAQPARIVFFGTPDAAARSLQALLEAQQATPPATWQVVGVVTRPPSAVGRKQTLTKSPVHELAEQHHVSVATPTKLDAAFVDWLRDLKPDVAVLTVYGKILPEAVLAVPRLGFVNVHPSLLPKHRGASPIVASILAGDRETGVSLMLLDREVDHGPVLGQQRVSLPVDATGGRLTEQLADVGARLLVETLPRYLDGSLQPKVQDHAAATFTKRLAREDGRLDWSQPAATLERTIRAYDPWPGTYTCLNGKRLKVLAASATADATHVAAVAPGTVTVTDGTLLVTTGRGQLRLDRVQLEGSTAQDGATFVRGHGEVDRARLRAC